MRFPKRCRLDTVVVRDGDEALQEIARRGAPALLIVDLSLPRVDGFAVIRKIPPGHAARRHADHRRRRARIAARGGARAGRAAGNLQRFCRSTSTAPRWPRSPPSVRAPPAEHSRAAAPRQRSAAMPDPGHRRRDRSRGDRSAAPLPDADQHRLPENRRRGKPVTFHVAAREPGPAAARSATSRTSCSCDRSPRPPIRWSSPNVESHPVFAQLLLKGRAARSAASRRCRSPTSRENIRAALCVLDTKPLTLTAGDIDALAAFGREVGQRNRPRALGASILDAAAEDHARRPT